MIGSLLPDIDFIFIFFSWFNSFHRGFTHSIFFILICTLFLLLKKYNKKFIISFLLGITLHLFIDSSMDSNVSNGIGIAIFYPFSKECYSFFNLLSVTNTELTWENPLKYIYHTFSLIIWEIPFISISLFILKNKGK